MQIDTQKLAQQFSKAPAVMFGNAIHDLIGTENNPSVLNIGVFSKACSQHLQKVYHYVCDYCCDSFSDAETINLLRTGIIPRTDKSCDFVVLINILHYCAEPITLLKEAGRVARKGVVIKDYYIVTIIGEIYLRLYDFLKQLLGLAPKPQNSYRAMDILDVFHAAKLMPEKSSGAPPQWWRPELSLFEVTAGIMASYIVRLKQIE